MEDTLQAVSWEAPEHIHIEKTSDWYWILGIIGLSGSIVSIILGNTLFGAVILLGVTTMFVVSHRHPRIIAFEVSTRGIRIKNDFYPYATLDSFYIDEMHDPQLLIRPKKLFMSFLIIPIPEKYTDDIEEIVGSHLRKEHLEEPIAHRLLEFFGF